MLRAAYAYLLTSLLICLALAHGCARKDQPGEQNDEKSEIMAALNRGDNEGALTRIDHALQAHPNDVELQYFKAQALSSKSEIDVYSLFPVLKIKLFEVAMTEWQSYQKYKALSESSSGGGLDQASREAALAGIDDMKKKLLTLKTEDIPFEIGVTYSYNQGSCFQYADVVSPVLRNMEKKGVFYGDDDLVHEYAMVPTGKECTDRDKAEFASRKTELQERIRGIARYQLERRRREIIDSKVAAAYIQGIYVLFDAVPILRDLPKYKHANLAVTSRALDILEGIRKRENKNTRFGKQSRQQITLIASYLLASVIRDSINLSDVVRPNDMICQLRADAVVDHYDIGLLALRHLFEVGQDTEIFDKNKSELEKQVPIENLRDEIYSLPEQPTDEIRKKITRFILNLQRQRDRC